MIDYLDMLFVRGYFFTFGIYQKYTKKTVKNNNKDKKKQIKYIKL